MAPRAKKILVGYDGSDAALRALDAAADLAGYGSTLAVVRVAGGGQDGGGHLGAARDRLLVRQKTADYFEVAGDPADTLVETARDLESDLIVVGRRSRNALRRLMLGSVSAKVVRRAPCDVLVVQ
jgi:nucleotide-binding universal stress UspA family protein